MAHHDLWTLDALIEAYKQHQRRTRGLREQTLHRYERLARLFVRAASETTRSTRHTSGPTT